MEVLITGHKGFIGQNLKKVLNDYLPEVKFLLFDKDNTYEELNTMCKSCDLVFHLAAVVRPDNPSDYSLNTSLTGKLLQFLSANNNKCPVMFSSSIQATLDNPYAKCKREEEKMLFDYGESTDVDVYVFRFPNLFGKYSKPNYTSVVSTFCYNTSHNLPITVNNPSAIIKFAYIENVLTKVINTILFDTEKSGEITEINEYYSVGLGELVYYMETLKMGIQPSFTRKDDFYEKLAITYRWFESVKL